MFEALWVVQLAKSTTKYRKNKVYGDNRTFFRGRLISGPDVQTFRSFCCVAHRSGCVLGQRRVGIVFALVGALLQLTSLLSLFWSPHSPTLASSPGRRSTTKPMSRGLKRTGRGRGRTPTSTGGSTNTITRTSMHTSSKSHFHISYTDIFTYICRYKNRYIYKHIFTCTCT